MKKHIERFKIGDVIECIDALGMKGSLVEGRSYIVLKVMGDNLDVRDLEDSDKEVFTYTYRFKLEKTYARDKIINTILE